MDGNRRYEVVTSCDHLHGSHASYSDRTQMLGYNMSLYADIWMRDKMFSAPVHGMSSGCWRAGALYKFICDFRVIALVLLLWALSICFIMISTLSLLELKVCWRELAAFLFFEPLILSNVSLGDLFSFETKPYQRVKGTVRHSLPLKSLHNTLL